MESIPIFFHQIVDTSEAYASTDLMLKIELEAFGIELVFCIFRQFSDLRAKDHATLTLPKFLQ